MTSLFWERGPDYHMSFPEFVNYHAPAQGRMLFAVMHEPSDGTQTLVGAMGLADFVGTYRAAVSFWLEPRWRGVNSMQFGKQLLTFCHANLNLENVYAFTPWRHAQEFCFRVGFIEVAEIPGFCQWGERKMDVSIFHSEREYWKQQMIANMRLHGFGEQVAVDKVVDIFNHSPKV